LNEVPVAFVIRQPGAKQDLAEKILAACRQKLASFKVPTEIRFVDEFPRSTLEKIAKAELRRLVQE
jgi:crotonobetaine/carnitine-CoA ligase